MELRVYPIDTNYIIKDGKPLIQLFCKTTEGAHICLLDNRFIPYFFVTGMSEDALKLLEQDGARVINAEKITRKINEHEHDVIKVTANIPKAVPILKQLITEQGATTYEADILFARRYLIDNHIIPFEEIIVECTPTAHTAKVPCYTVHSIRKGDSVHSTPRMLALDIETYNPDGKNMNAKKHPIITIALYGEGFQKILTWKQFACEGPLEVLASEADMIQRMIELIEEHKPDLLVGYFSDGFDMPYIKDRAEQHKLKLPLGLDYSELRVGGRIYKDARIAGIVHIDIFKYVRNVVGKALKTDSLSLNSVSEEILGAQKHDVDLDQLADIWDNYPEQMGLYADYNLQDTKLTYDLCKTLFPGLLELVRLIGLDIYDVNRMPFSQLVEWYLIRRSQEFNEMIPNRPSRTQEMARMKDRVQGAFVYEPKPGLYENIIIFDYRSLYPSIIASLNISIGTLNCSCCDDAPRLETERGTFWFCKKRQGLFSTVIQDIILKRSEVKQAYKETNDPLLEARSQALKLLANSFYGYVGFAPARWYCKECAESTTGWARHYIHKTIDTATNQGFKVLYSDTDSVFLLLEGHTKQDALDLVAHINKELPGLMELEYEGFYLSGLFVSLKSAQSGAKKKYALLGEDQNITIKGFETVRRNWSFIAKDVQRTIIEIVLKEKDIEKARRYVREVVDKLRTNKIPKDKVVIHTQITKPLESYANIGPHVAAAKQMREKGSEPTPGSIIKYVVTKGEGKIRDKVKLAEEATQDEYDGEYYITHQIIPGVERIFAVLGVHVDEFSKKTTQTGLGGYL